jgi:predicted O-methyltransferase YrrM
MFHQIPLEIQERMDYLYKIDSLDRQNGTPRLQRLRQIPPDTGKFISLLLASSPKGNVVEIGTSAGYSTLWLSLAYRETGRIIHTFEILDEKTKMAKKTFQSAKVQNVVKLVEGDALENLKGYNDISFCFLDAEKEIYSECYDLIVPKLVSGGILVADNAINHYDTLKPFIEKALCDPRVDALVVPIGKGELVCRKI